MAITLILEDGTGKVDSNTYADEAFALAYFEAHLYPEAWVAATPERQKAALVSAFRMFNTYVNFIGDRKTIEQAGEFPRTGITIGTLDYPDDEVPSDIASAACEQALVMLKEDRSDGRDEDNLKAVSVGGGAVKLELHQREQTERIPSNVMELMSKWGKRGTDQDGTSTLNILKVSR